MNEIVCQWLWGHGLVLVEAMSFGATFVSGAIFIGLSSTLSAVLRGIGTMRFPAMTVIVGSGIKVTLAGGLILGWLGLPKLGLVTAPLSVIANGAFVSLVSFVKLSRHSARVQLKLSQLLFEKALFKDTLYVALPAFLASVSNVGTIILMIGLFGWLLFVGGRHDAQRFDNSRCAKNEPLEKTLKPQAKG